MTSSKTNTPLTAEQKSEMYDNGLTELTEKKKLGLLAQDEYDKLHHELVERVYGKPQGD